MFYDQALRDFTDYLLAGRDPEAQNNLTVNMDYRPQWRLHTDAYIDAVVECASYNGCNPTTLVDPDGGNNVLVTVGGNHVALLRFMCMVEVNFSQIRLHFERLAREEAQAQTKAKHRAGGIWGGPRNSRHRADVSD